MATVSELKAEAKELGRNWYSQLKPCTRGHKWRRYNKNGNCVLCYRHKGDSHE